MGKNIQKVFSLIRKGNKNAFLELNIKLRIFMNPNPDIGEITQIYNHYHIEESTREEINSDITLVIIEKILESNQLDNMKNWIEFKWYAKRVCSNLIKKHFRENTIRGQNEQIDYVFDDDDEPISRQFEGGVKIEHIDYEEEYKKIYDQILKLTSKQCKDILIAERAGKSAEETLIHLRKKYRIKNRNNLSTRKNKCKDELKKRVRKDVRFSSWREIFEN